MDPIPFLLEPSRLRAPISDVNDSAIADLIIPISEVADPLAILCGIPFDTTTMGRAGSRYAPAAIRNVLAGMLGYNADFGLDLCDGPRIADAGDVDVLHTDVEQTWHRISAVTETLASLSKPLIIMGGDHGLTFPVLRGLTAVHGALGVVNIDGHFDLRPSHHGQPASGVPFRYALERLDGKVNAKNCTHIGMTGWRNSRFAADYASAAGLTVVSGASVTERAPGAVATEAVARGAEGSSGVWVSVDIDAVDGAFAPGTSSPTVGGMSSRELLELVWAFGSSPEVLGIDIVEVSPPLDPSGITQQLGAAVALTFACGQLARAGGSESDGRATSTVGLSNSLR